MRSLLGAVGLGFAILLGSWIVSDDAVQAGGPDKSGVGPQVINLPSGPGTIQGLGESFEPQLNTGTASYGVGIAAPPGTGGLAPSLAISYNGGYGNGPCGLGWRLNLPYIQRQTDKGLPSYLDTDLFVHSSGEELVPLADGSYRFKIEGAFTRFRRQGAAWEVTERDGTRWLYGETGNGRQANEHGVFAWFPQRATDTNGNEIRFFYVKDGGQIYLSEVRYNFDRADGFGQEQKDTYVSIKIEYESRPDPVLDYRSRTLERTAWRTKFIEITSLGKRVRRYELSYDASSGVSLLTAVRLLGRDLVRWEDDPTKGIPPVRFGYTTFDPKRAQNVSMSGAPPLSVGNPNVDLVDINGDALPDLLQTQTTGGHRFFLNRGEGRWQSDPISPSKSPPALLSTAGVQLADVDGDGRSDFVVKTGSNPSSAFAYYPNLGGSTWELDNRVDFPSNPPFTYEDTNVRLVDLDNDRRIDVLRTTSSNYFIYFNREVGWSTGPDRIVSPLNAGSTLTFDDARVTLADMNGDRLQDIVFLADSQVIYFPSKGMGDFDAAVQMTGSPSLGGRGGRRLVDDVNGDGLSDLLLVERFGVSVWLNRAATGFASEERYSNTPEFKEGETELRVADMNGDGASDLLYSTYPGGSPDILRYLDFAGGTPPYLLTSIDNGLGRVIGLEYRTSTDYYVDDWDAGRPWTLRSPVPVTVVSRSTVKDKLSGQVYTTDYVYRNAYYDGKEKTFRGFALAEQIDRGDATAPTQVQRLIFDTGAQDESRKGLVLQQDILDEGGTCGPDEPLAAASAATAGLVSAAAGPKKCFTRTLNQPKTRTLANATDGRAMTFSFVAQTDGLIYESTATPRRTQQRVEYDDYGNAVESFDYGEVALDGSNPALGNDERLSYTEYINNLDKWLLGVPVRSRTTALDGSFVSEQRSYYDGPDFVGLPFGQAMVGNLTRVEANLGPQADGGWVQMERYRYDRYGNQIGRMDPNGKLTANGKPADVGYWTEVAYDAPYHIFPVMETIHLGQGTTLAMHAEYDLSLGVIQQATDFNGHPLRFKHDGLARVTAIVKPGDTPTRPTQSFVYTLGGAISSVETSVRERSGTGNVYRSLAYFDGLGRTLQARSEGEDGKVVVDGAVAFNGRGQPHAQYQPYLADTFQYQIPPVDVAKTELVYDALMRVVETRNPDATVARVHFRPFAQHLYDEEDSEPSSPHFDTPVSHYFDGLGRLVRVEERNQGDTYTTRYSYDLLDNLTRIVDARGNIKTQTFDGLSRKLQMNDPDSGVRRYSYDDAGNLLETEDAKGQVIRYSYDGANRLIAETYGEGADASTPDVRYHYDYDLSSAYPDAQNTLARLAWIEDLAGAEYLSYDERGNLSGRIRRIEQTGGAPLDFVMLMDYDAMDRMVQLAYPDGTRVDYKYNSRTLLDAIPGYVKSMVYTAAGQLTLMRYANGVTTRHAYDVRLRLKSLSSKHDNGKVLQQWSYSFDGVSNIVGIQDLRPNRTKSDDDTRTFTMDDLYRLTAVQYPISGDHVGYTYDAIGNLVQKTSSIPKLNLGLVQYGQSGRGGPHALTQVGSVPWRYDANGNLIEKPDYALSWDTLDRMIAVDGPDGLRQEHHFDYGGGRMVKLVQTNEGNKRVLYPSRNVEVRGDRLVKTIFAGDTRVAEIRTPFSAADLIRGFNGEAPPAKLLDGFDKDDSGNISVPEIAARGGNPQKIELDEIDDALTLFFAHTEEPGSPLDFATISAALEAYGVPLQAATTVMANAELETVFYHGDHLGSASAMADGLGNVVEWVSYYPYGLERSRVGDASMPYRYTGQEQDREINLYYYGARFYDAELGRFISADPLYSAQPDRGLVSPRLLSLYTYALNNPARMVDPTGMKPTDMETVNKLAKAIHGVPIIGKGFNIATNMAIGVDPRQDKFARSKAWYDIAVDTAEIGAFAAELVGKGGTAVRLGLVSGVGGIFAIMFEFTAMWADANQAGLRMSAVKGSRAGYYQGFSARVMQITPTRVKEMELLPPDYGLYSHEGVYADGYNRRFWEGYKDASKVGYFEQFRTIIDRGVAEFGIPPGCSETDYIGLAGKALESWHAKQSESK